MANRRMFAKSITNSSKFLMMPDDCQNLYFHLGMNADDDGYVEYFGVMRMCGSNPDTLKVLQAKRYVHLFDDSVLFIIDWFENNYVPKDRYHPSKYLSHPSYCIQVVYKMYPEVRLGKDRLIERPINKRELSITTVLDEVEKGKDLDEAVEEIMEVKDGMS